MATHNMIHDLPNPPHGRRRVINTSEDPAKPSTLYKYRAGAPALNLLPLETIYLDQESDTFKQLDDRWEDIEASLATYEVKTSAVYFAHRTIPGDEPNASNVFVYVQAIWDDAASDNWLSCANYIRSKLAEAGITVGVEIIAHPLFEPKCMSVVESGHEFFAAWESTIKQKVFVILDERPTPEARPFCQEPLSHKVVAINVIRLGYRSAFLEPKRNPVTILLTVAWSVDPRSWAIAQREIEEELGQQWEEIVVLFEHGETFYYTNSEFLPQDVAACRELHNRQGGGTVEPPYDIIRPGASIGGAVSLTEVGGTPVLGGYGSIGPILTLSKNGRQEAVCALTNYEVVRDWIPGYIVPNEAEAKTQGYAEEGSLLEKMDRLELGFGPNEPADYTESLRKMKSPAVKVLARSLFEAEAYLKWDIDILTELREEEQEEAVTELSEEEKQEEAANIQRLEAKIETIRINIESLKKMLTQENPTFCGQVWMGSSPMQRTSEKGTLERDVQGAYVRGAGPRLDYVLIKLDEGRLSKASNTLPSKSKYPPLVQARVTPRMSRLRGIAPISKNKTLFKNGARTGVTVGEFSEFKSTMILPGDGDTVHSSDEFMVIGLPPPLGDSSPFADKGDSGSAVYSRGGHWVGVVFGGTPVSQTGKDPLKQEHCSYVTAAEDIVEHIKGFQGEGWIAKIWSP